MHWLTGYELRKTWGRKSFLASLCLLFFLNLFLLWYHNLPGEGKPGLAAYKRFQEKINGMTETEKENYVSNLKETMDGVGFVEEVLMMRNMSDEMGDILAQQLLGENPGLFEAWYEKYQSGEYLQLTDSLRQEALLVSELHAQWEKSAGYGEYLEAVQETEDTLGSIGIFRKTEENSFSTENIRKSAADYAGLTSDGISWMPDKAVTGSMENLWTDILLVLSVFFFVGSLILEEKEKSLFYITRSTKFGIFRSICAKILALLFHCMAAAILLYGSNLLYFGSAVGYGDLNAKLQSLAAYRDSTLSVSILEYIGLSVATKAVVLFGFGTLLTALCILADTVYLPYLAGGMLWGLSFLLYTVIPAAAKKSLFKYLNFAGMMKTENLYGSYLNFNIMEKAVSRTKLVWIAIMIVVSAGILASMFLFARGNSFVLRERRRGISLGFRPGISVTGQEGYKILIANRALVILLFFGLLLGYREWEQKYSLTSGEEYYQSMMRQLAGELTEEKRELVLKEQARYQEAFEEIEKIDRMVFSGELTERMGEELKAEWYAVTAFYPYYSRVWQQYQGICENGGCFIYDTGYLYLLGTGEDDFLIPFLLLNCCMVLAFGNAVSMEDENGSWNLIGATRTGKGKILRRKAFVCAASAGVMVLVFFAGRMAGIARVFPMGGLWYSVRNIPRWGQFAFPLPVIVFLLLVVISQALVLVLAALVVFGLSWWRRNPVQACLFAAAFLVVPLVLALLGFSWAGRFSLYPFFSWTASGM